MQGFFRIKQGIQGIFGILFVFWLLYGLFVLRFLRGYLLTCYNLIGQRCVNRPFAYSLVVFLIFDYLQSCFSLVGGFLILVIVPSFYQYIPLSFPIKKKKASALLPHVTTGSPLLLPNPYLQEYFLLEMKLTALQQDPLQIKKKMTFLWQKLQSSPKVNIN